MARLIGFSMPTLCIFNGHAIAGGYILGLCHDARIMNDNFGNICLSELKLGLPLPPPYQKVVSAKLPAAIANNLFFAIDIDKKDALKLDLIDSTYKNSEDLDTQIAAYVKRYAKMGA